ncbi:unnamed protein product, partial [marine sediment metagenome]
NCIINVNCSDHKGGGFYTIKGQISNCIISGNSASDYGGAMYLDYHSPTLLNCTFSGNSASEGNSMYNAESNPVLTNCILWDGWQGGIYNHYSAPVITYSNVQGGWPGTGNIDADPCFIEPGYWDANGVWIDGDYHLLPDSPCIDAGDPNYIAEPNETDLDGKPRIIGGRIDMGAYEAPIFAEARILPRTINLASKGKWITAFLWLPEDYNVADIDPNSIFLEDEIQPDEFSAD